MAKYRIVDTYDKRDAVKGIHYNTDGIPMLAYRVDKRHSLLFGLIHYWDYGASTLCPKYRFYSINEAREAILNAEKTKRVEILYK